MSQQQIICLEAKQIYNSLGLEGTLAVMCYRHPLTSVKLKHRGTRKLLNVILANYGRARPNSGLTVFSSLCFPFCHKFYIGHNRDICSIFLYFCLNFVPVMCTRHCSLLDSQDMFCLPAFSSVLLICMYVYVLIFFHIFLLQFLFS